MDRLTEIETFVRVVETGSFSLVARERQCTQSSISKQVASLERRLELALLNRSTRALSLTDEGQRYYQHCRVILEAFQDAQSDLLERQQELVGSLRVTASVGFGRLMIVPHLHGFLAQHPRLQIDVNFSDRVVDLIEQGVDLAIRIADLRDSSLYARQIGLAYRLLVATPEYLARRGTPRKPADLSAHNCLVYSGFSTPNEWTLQAAAGGEESVRVSGNFRTNSAESLREAVLSGLGISLGPLWMYADDLAAGRVVSLLPEYHPRPIPIYAVTPVNAGRSRKVREFTAFLAQRFAQEPSVRMRPGESLPAAELSALELPVPELPAPE